MYTDTLTHTHINTVYTIIHYSKQLTNTTQHKCRHITLKRGLHKPMPLDWKYLITKNTPYKSICTWSLTELYSSLWNWCNMVHFSVINTILVTSAGSETQGGLLVESPSLSWRAMRATVHVRTWHGHDISLTFNHHKWHPKWAEKIKLHIDLLGKKHTHLFWEINN